MEQLNNKIDELVKGYKKEIIDTLGILVSYDSVLDETDPLYPFGKQNALCLQKALEIANTYGLKTVNLDNYIGYGEIGTGSEVIGVIGHLDIVPCGQGWNSDPLKIEIIDNKIYGRGTSDDKGPVVAALFAFKVIQDLKIPLNKKLRLIMGSNEETGSKCLEHYVAKMGHVDYGFTPDANFPGTFGEKGMISANFTCNETKIIDIKGGVAPNVVCNHVHVVIKKADINYNQFIANLISNDMKYEISEQQDNYEIDIYGVAAHASTPNLGKNAINYAIVALHNAGFVDGFVNEYARLINVSSDGDLFNCDFCDEYGSLTFNNGMISMENGCVTGSIDIRFPVTNNTENVSNALIKGFDSKVIKLNINSMTEPLFFETQSKLVKALVSAYQDITKDFDSKPSTMGGGTYAKGINNTIAFGGSFENDEDVHMHDANEFIKVDNLLLQCSIYVKAIINLLEL